MNAVGIDHALEHKRRTLKTLKAEQAAAPVPFSLPRVIVAAVVMLVIVLGIATGEVGNVWLWVSCGVALLLVAASSSESIQKVRRFRTPEMKSLAKEISAMSKVSRELAEMENSLSTLDPRVYECKTTQELVALQVERQELVARVMGEGSVAKLLRDSAPDAGCSGQTYAVILDNPTTTDSLMRAVRKLRPDRTYSHVKMMIFMGTVVVLANGTKADAEKAKQKLTKAGGKVRLLPDSEVPTNLRRL